MHEFALDRRVPRVERFAVARCPCLHGGRRTRDGHERNPPRSKPQQVLGDAIAGAAVVDADQIVHAAFRVRDDRAIQHDDRNAGVVERSRNLPVDGVLARRQFERREEDAGHPALDVLTA